MDRDFPVLFDQPNEALRLDVDVFLVARVVLRLDYSRSGCKRLFGVSLYQLVFGEAVVVAIYREQRSATGVFDTQNGRKIFVVDDGSFEQRLDHLPVRANDE